MAQSYKAIMFCRMMALLTAMLFFFYDARSQANSDTLQEVKIRSKRRQRVSGDDRINTFAPGQKVTTIDSITLQQYQYQNIANLLSQQVPVFVKSYGVNNLATLNFRGSSAAQSQVYWNGIPLQNAALGIADVSLLPVALINKVNIMYGGSAALWGSGNIGGALMIENELPAFDSNGSTSNSVSATAGSYSQYQLGLQSSVSTRRLALSASATGQTARNNFSYSDNNRRLTMDNALLQSGALLAQAGYKISAQSTLKLTGWYQQYYREIPKALFESVSQKNQRDESLRLLADWNFRKVKSNYHIKAAFLSDYLLYQDPQALLRSATRTSQVYAEAAVKHSFGMHHQLLLFTPVHLSWMQRELLNDTKNQSRVALAIAYAYNAFGERLNIAVNMRGEMINDLGVLMPGVNAAYAINNWLTVKGNVQRTYRAPTLNELYYYPGGNERLKPEHGWTQDAGYAIRTSAAPAVTFQHDLSFFNRNIKDWIIWFGGAIWTPHNIATVHSRGIETENKLTYRTGRYRLHLGINTAYVLATTEETYTINDGSLGMQIPYTPRYNGQANIGISVKGLYINYNHTYTGYRFITTDESQYVSPYQTGNIQALYTVEQSKYPVQATLQLNNIWSERYNVVNARPMPGFNWLAGVKVSF